MNTSTLKTHHGMQWSPETQLWQVDGLARWARLRWHLGSRDCLTLGMEYADSFSDKPLLTLAGVATRERHDLGRDRRAGTEASSRALVAGCLSGRVWSPCDARGSTANQACMNAIKHNLQTNLELSAIGVIRLKHVFNRHLEQVRKFCSRELIHDRAGHGRQL